MSAGLDRSLEGLLLDFLGLRQGPLSLRVGELIAEGGGGKVYLANQPDTGRRYVIKQPKSSQAARFSAGIERAVLAGIDHANIIELVALHEETTSGPLLVYELLAPNPLLRLRELSPRPKGPQAIALPAALAADFGLELLKAVRRLHQDGYVHHDIKLDNLMLRWKDPAQAADAEGYLAALRGQPWRGVLVDAGGVRNTEYQSRINAGERTAVAPELTPLFAPPEALIERRNRRGELARHFSMSIDLYQCSLVIYTLFTGCRPYSHLPSVGRDFSALLDLKASEARGQACAIDQRPIETSLAKATFLNSRHSQFEQRLFQFLWKRLQPDPAKRGNANEMLEDYDALLRFGEDPAAPKLRTRFSPGGEDRSVFRTERQQVFQRAHSSKPRSAPQAEAPLSPGLGAPSLVDDDLLSAYGACGASRPEARPTPVNSPAQPPRSPTTQLQIPMPRPVGRTPTGRHPVMPQDRRPPSGPSPIPPGRERPPTGRHPVMPQGRRPPSGPYPIPPRRERPPTGRHPVVPQGGRPPSGAYPIPPGRERPPIGRHPVMPQGGRPPSGAYPIPRPDAASPSDSGRRRPPSSGRIPIPRPNAASPSDSGRRRPPSSGHVRTPTSSGRRPPPTQRIARSELAGPPERPEPVKRRPPTQRINKASLLPPEKTGPGDPSLL